MGLYESNFIRLGWLAGDLRTLAGRYHSAVRGDCDLVLTVTARSPYTRTLGAAAPCAAQEGTQGQRGA